MGWQLLVLLTLWIPALIVYLSRILDLTLSWQEKEYRLDRMMSQLRQQQSGLSLMNLVNLLLITLASLYLVFPIKVLLVIPILTMSVFLLKCWRITKQIVNRELKRPKIKSPRNILIVFISLSIIFATFIIYLLAFDFDQASSNFFSFNSNNEIIPSLTYLAFISTILINLIELLIPGIVLLVVIMTEPLAKWRRKKILDRAKLKLDVNPDLKIIAITGSYGKTGTKEILAKLLSAKYKVASTIENYNTEVGIALSILEKLDKETEIFIAEMGAYKRGEIKVSTELIPPDISIVTNVGKAHLDIFGSIDNTALAKYEIIENLKKDGIAILNGANKYTLEMAGKTKQNVILFSVDRESSNENYNELKLNNVEWDGSKLNFIAKYKGHTEEFETVLIGEQQIDNLAAAMTCALALGMTFSELKEVLSTSRFESSHFKVYTGKNGVKIIDDGYTSNPVGFEVALNHFSLYPELEKVVLTRGLLEVGKEIKMIYKDLSAKIATRADVLITTDELLHSEVSRQEGIKSVLVSNDKEINAEIENYLNDKTVILIEGRVSPRTMEIIRG